MQHKTQLHDRRPLFSDLFFGGRTPRPFNIVSPSRANIIGCRSRPRFGSGGQILELRMSRASPGRYSLHDFAKNVYDVHAFASDGRLA